MNTGVKGEKDRIRREALAERLAMTDEERQTADAAMLTRFIALASFRFAKVVLLYYPVKGEPNVLGCAAAALAAGKKIAFPKCDPASRTMTFRIVSSPDELVPGAYGIPEPPDSALPYQPSKNEHDLCVVPGVCFDRQGHRIGYGGGYYDRFLASFGGASVGLAPHRFLKNELPHGRFDRPVDLILTEKGVFHSR